MKSNKLFKGAFTGMVVLFALVALGCPPPTGGDGSGEETEPSVNVGAASSKDWLSDQQIPFLYAGDGPATNLVQETGSWDTMEARDAMLSMVQVDGSEFLRLDLPFGHSHMTWVFPEDPTNPSAEGTFDSAATTATVSVDLNIQWYDAPDAIWQYGWFEFFVAGGKKTTNIDTWAGEAVGGTFIKKFETGATLPSATYDIIGDAGVTDLGNGWVRLTVSDVPLPSDPTNKKVTVGIKFGSAMTDWIPSVFMDNLMVVPNTSSAGDVAAPDVDPFDEMVLPPASDDWYLDNDAAASYPRAISSYTKVALVDYDDVFDDRIANLYSAPNGSGGTKLVVAQPYGNTRLAWVLPRNEDDAYDITETFDSTATGATVSFDLKLDWTAYQPASDFSGTLDIYALAGDHETLDPAQLDGDDDDGTSLDPALSFSAGSGDPSSTGEIVSIAGVQDLGDGWIRVTLPEVDFTAVDDEDKQVTVLFDVSNRVADHVTSFELDNLEATPTLP